MGSEAIAVPPLKEKEFAQITMLGVHVSFPNAKALSFVLRKFSIDCASFFCAKVQEFTSERILEIITQLKIDGLAKSKER
ncbi:hypothetical protein Tco_1424259, partial [Tanacetum coccineum]